MGEDYYTLGLWVRIKVMVSCTVSVSVMDWVRDSVDSLAFENM